jgi:acetyl esterase/lipase
MIFRSHPNSRSRKFRPAAVTGLESRLVMSSGGMGLSVASHVRRIHEKSAADTYHLVRNVIYRDIPGDQQALDLMVPDGPVPEGGRPVIVAIHGGGWRRFSKEEYEPTVAAFARLGYIVAVPNYQLSKPGSPTWPINFEEIQDAVRWVRSHATDLGANPNKIAAMGASAGGHLAALLGTDTTPTSSDVSAKVQAVVDFYGPTDLAALQSESKDASGAIHQFLGTTPAQDPALYAAASPISHVSASDPPFLIVQGTVDPVVVESQSSKLAATLSAAGVPNQLVMIPGAGHGFGLKVGGHNLLSQVDQFLSASLK